MFSSTGAGDLTGRVQIQNISRKIVGYKIKTTSPEKYRVRPSTGSLSPGLTATVEIHVSGGQATSSLVRDKFLITAVFLESSELGQQQLADALKSSKPDGQYRLRCQLAGNLSDQSGDLQHGGQGQGVRVSQVDTDGSRQVANILKKVIIKKTEDTIFNIHHFQVNQLAIKQEELSTQLRLCLHLELVLVGLIILLLVIMLFYTNTDCT